MNFSIRKASASDISGIVSLNIRSWNSTYRGLVTDSYIDKMTPETVAAKWERTFSDTTDPLKFTLVATDENDIPIGYAL